MDAVHLERAGFVGWSDGACTAFLAAKAQPRVAGVFFFGCNMDPSGLKPIIEPSQILDCCLTRHAKDYAQLAATPDEFKPFFDAVGLMMKTQPDYSAHDLAEISVPVLIVQSEHDEFIKRQAFARLVAQGWTDALRKLHPDGPLWTFWDYKRERWPADKGMRLDHFLLSPEDVGATRGWRCRPMGAWSSKCQPPRSSVDRAGLLTLYPRSLSVRKNRSARFSV